MAQPLAWMPDSLYNYSISSVVTNYSTYEKDVRTFHGCVIFDVYYKLYKDGLLYQLGREFENLDLFHKVLKVSDKRFLLHNCFQTLMDQGYQMALKLANEYQKKCISILNSTSDKKDEVINLGFLLGSFLTDAGWFPESEMVFSSCLQLCHINRAFTIWELTRILDCYKRLLHVQNVYCSFKEAEATFEDALNCIQQIENLHLSINLSSIYSEFATFYFLQSNYKEAYSWSNKSIERLDSTVSPRELVKILRIASKSCVVKKQFQQAGFLIKQAVQKTREKFGDRSLLYAAALVDYGYYLLHTDATAHAIEVYQKALDIHIEVLGGRNILVAVVHEDLAYAAYVHEYSTGRFKDAREIQIKVIHDGSYKNSPSILSKNILKLVLCGLTCVRDHIKKASAIKESLLPEDHFLLPSAKRIHALIVEEIAIDSHDKDLQERFFAEAEELHTSALQITVQCLGKKNVQTGKHFGNLGRLYQSMRKFNEARKMHLEAISIKQEILGINDYEVAISMGHLASLYNYDLGLYEEAITLYKKAIEIGLKQFGNGYSGLEYDYRGLMSVYTALGDDVNVSKLHADLSDWKLLRDQSLEKAKLTSPLNIDLKLVGPEEIHSHFSKLQSHPF